MSNGSETVDLTPAELSEKRAKEQFHLIDVREPHEFQAGKIPGAVNLPLSRFDPAAVPTDMPVVFYCGAGRRSQTALQHCQRAGLSHDTHLAGGIGAWRAAGLPVVTPAADRLKR